ncbi:MAG: hypothetical protein ABEH66_05255 [Halobacteriales archaeon]
MTYQRTASIPLPDHPEHGIDLSGVRTTDTQQEERYLQLVHLPDERDCTDDRTGAELGRREVYELAVREPREVVTRDGTPHPLSAVVERHGPYSRESVLAEAADLADTRDLPVFHEVIHLRPDGWTDPGDWVTCPTCGSEAITLVTNLDDSDLTLLCRECDATVDETERRALFDDWLHCPSCGSGDLNVELSAPRGGVRWSCDDCRYDTVPAPIDVGYADAREP